MTTDVDPGEFCRGKTERSSFFLVPHEQIQMQVKKHIPRYPNPLIFAFLHFNFLITILVPPFPGKCGSRKIQTTELWLCVSQEARRLAALTGFELCPLCTGLEEKN